VTLGIQNEIWATTVQSYGKPTLETRDGNWKIEKDDENVDLKYPLSYRIG
jgi:hypothetical protein